jgi:hypothetical protein
MADRKINIVIKAVDDASRVISNIGTKALPDLAKRVAGFAAGIASVATVGEIIGSAFKSALSSEQATEKLTAALEAQKLSVASYLPHLESYAGSLSHVTKATDEEIKGAQQLLISVGRLSGDALDRATVSALNLSSGLGIDLNDSALKIAKAANGSVREFTRLGVKFGDTATDGEKLARVMEFIEQRFGGSAQSEVTTMAGKIDLLTKAWKELNEQIALQLTGRKEVPGALDAITAALNVITDSVEKGRLKEASGIITAITSALGGNLDIGFWLQLFDSVEHLKMVDLSNLRLAFKFPEQADPVLGKFKADIDAQEDAAKAAQKAAAARAAVIAKFKENTETQTFAAVKPEPKTPVAGTTTDAVLRGIVDEALTNEATAVKALIDSLAAGEIPPDKIKESSDLFDRLAEDINRATEAMDGFKGKKFAPVDADAFKDVIRQADILRESEQSLDTPVSSIADSWARVLSVMQQVAAAMPKGDTAAVEHVQHLLETARIASEKANAPPLAMSGDDRIKATQDALASLQEAIAAISYLTPEQKKELDSLVGSMLKAGKTAESLGATMKDAFAGAATNAAVQLGDTLVDAAFGAKVSWGDALRDIIKGLIKAVIQALIMKAITTAIAAASGGGVVSSGGVSASEGAVVPGFAGGGTVPKHREPMTTEQPMVYAAGGAPMLFKPRGTDTVPAMLTPGEIVLPKATAQALLKGQVTIAAGKGDKQPGAKSLFGGKIAIVPTRGQAIAIPQAVITIKPSKQAATFASGGLVGSLPSFAAAGLVLPSITRMKAPMLTPADIALPSGVSYQSLAGPASAARTQPVASPQRIVNLNVQAMDAKSFEKFLENNSRALTNVLDYVDSRGA